MQTRMDLYDFLGYHDYERKLDELFKNEESTGGKVMAESKETEWGGTARTERGPDRAVHGREDRHGSHVSRLRHLGTGRRRNVRGSRVPDPLRRVAEQEATRRVQGQAEEAARAAEGGQGRARANSEVDAPDGRDAHGLLDSRQRRARGRLQSAARRGRSLARRRCRRIINYWYRFSHDGVRIETETDEDSLAGHFLYMLLGNSPSELHQRVMDVSLILYAEHEFNASTFTARVCASTLSDMHSCVTGAIGSLRGPLHGGANEAAMEMIEKFGSPDDATAGIKGMLERKDKIMGFGHAIYATSDPRNAIIKSWAEKLAKRRWRQGSVPGLGRRRKSDVGREEAVRERRLLPRVRVSLHGHPDEAVHADLRLFACVGLDRARHGTALQQSHHSAERGLCRSRAAPLRQTGRSMKGDNQNMSANVDLNVRPDPDKELVDIADYVTGYKIQESRKRTTRRAIA